VAVGVTEGGLALITSASAQKQRANQALAPPAGSFSSPKAGLGATVGTLNQGYPLLQCEGTVPTRLSLVAS
jgi:hypothetical protein